MGFRPCGASHFFLLRQEKVSKKKATLGRCRLRRFPALLGTGGGCGTRPCGPQTVLALFPPTPALLGASQGARQTDRNFAVGSWSTADGEIATPFGAPMWSAEQRRRAGGSRRGLSEARRAEFRSRPALRAAQGSRRSRPRSLGSPSSLATFFLARQEESMPAGQRRNPAHQKTTPARQARKTAPTTKHYPE